MKKIHFLTALLLYGVVTHGQHQTLDTLYANSHQVVSLRFEQPIQKGITGSANYAFTYDREKGQKLGVLQAQEGRESNLLVATTDGQLYGFILAYREDLELLHHRIVATEALDVPIKDLNHHKAPIPSKKDTLKVSDQSFARACAQLLRRPRFLQQVRRQKGIRIKVTQSVYHQDAVYMVYELKNSSSIPYALEQLQLFKVLGTRKRKSSYQALPIAPLYQHQLPKVVGQDLTVQFVVVYPKFTLNPEENLQLRLKEAQGSRNFAFKLR